MVGPKLLIGKNITVPFGNVQGDFENDLPRGPHGMALIGDPRNDENLLVAQTHLTFMKFHNTVCNMLAPEGKGQGELFAKARQTVMWHYQWMILHDFVERSEEHTSELQTLMSLSYAVFCLKKSINTHTY